MSHTIVVNETVTMVGLESTVYESPYTLEEIKALIVEAGDAETLAGVESWQVKDWLETELAYTDSGFTGNDVVERFDVEIEEQG